jgi:polysaccharide transporter, PST family
MKTTVDMLKEAKKTSASGGAVTFLIQISSAVIQFASSVVLARLLGPKDFGIMAMAATVVAFVGVFSSLGLLNSTVRSTTLTRQQQNNLFWIQNGLGVISAVIVLLLAPVAGRLFSTPELPEVLMALSSIFIIGNLSLQFSVELIRELKFAQQGIATIGGVIVSISTSIWLAFRGFHCWSFVWGQIAGAVTTSCMLASFSTFRPGKPSLPVEVGGIIKLGGFNTLFELFNYWHRNLGNILIGKYCGAVPLGFYSRAYSLLMFPINNIRGPIGSVAYPLMSRLQHDPKLLRDYYLHVTSILALLSMPLIAFLFVASKPLILLFYGEKWLAVSPIFSLLALAAFVQPVSGLANQLMMALDQGRRNLQCGIFCAVAFMLSFVIGLPWGPRGIALAYMIANYIVLLPWLHWAFLESPVTLKDFLKACRFAASSSLVAAGLSLVAGRVIPGLLGIREITMDAACFVAVFGGVMWLTPAGRHQVNIWREILGHFNLRRQQPQQPSNDNSQASREATVCDTQLV